jgi:hypothetical protein
MPRDPDDAPESPAPTPPGDADAPANDAHAPPAPAASGPRLPRARPAREGGRPAVTRAFLEAYLSRPETQRHIRNVVAGALGRQATRPLEVDEADSEEKVPAWVDGIARNRARMHFGELREEAKHVDRSAPLDELKLVYTPTVADSDGWMIGPWLREQIADNAHERELYDLIVYKARSKKTYAEIAAEKGTTLASLSNRIYRLRQKYEPLYKQHRRERQRMIVAWILRAVALAVLGYIAWLLLHHETVPVRPDVFPPPAPSATSSAAPVEPFMPAEPSGTPQEPVKPKP